MTLYKIPRDKDNFNYMNEDFRLNVFPLDSYLEKREDIIIKEKSYENPEYIASWRFENNKLYLSDLKCQNYSIADIFNTNELVLAEWFSGTIKIGIGEEYNTHISTFFITSYENYIWKSS